MGTATLRTNALTTLPALKACQMRTSALTAY